MSFGHAEPDGPVSPDLLALARLLPLHDGEVEALRIAVNSSGMLLLTDDSAARLAARSLGIPSHGTIGVLVRSIRREQRSRNAVLTILRQLPFRSTLYVKPELLDDVIRSVEQSGI